MIATLPPFWTAAVLLDQHEPEALYDLIMHFAGQRVNAEWN